MSKPFIKILLLLVIVWLLYQIKAVEFYRYEDDELILDDTEYEDEGRFGGNTGLSQYNKELRKREEERKLQEERAKYKEMQDKLDEEKSKRAQAALSEPKPVCKGRCDCCYKDKNSNDRAISCYTKYGKNKAAYDECMSSNSKYAYESCLSMYGSKGLFGFGKKCE